MKTNNRPKQKDLKAHITIQEFLIQEGADNFAEYLDKLEEYTTEMERQAKQLRELWKAALYYNDSVYKKQLEECEEHEKMLIEENEEFENKVNKLEKENQELKGRLKLYE